LASQSLSGRRFNLNAYSIDPLHLSPTPVAPDSPAGSIVSIARAWWTESGSKVNWHPSYDICDP
jgi:hypothetical protein